MFATSQADAADRYITPRGQERLIEQRRRLWSEERPAALREIELAAGNADRWEKGNDSNGQRKRLQDIDRRIVMIDERLASAIVVEPARTNDEVHFGATVRFRREDGREIEATIVGCDETGPHRISCVSPVARALMGKRAGEEAWVSTPAGEESIMVLEVSYDA